MTKLKHILLPGAAACMITFGAGNAGAVTTFQFSTQSASPAAYGNSLSMTSGGITVTETAWWLTASPTVGTSKFATASLAAYSGYGLGVCNGNEGLNCGDPHHQVDNATSLDFVLFTFSAPVNLTSIVLDHYSAAGGAGTGDDADLTFWTPSTGLTTSSTWMGGGTTINNTGVVPCTSAAPSCLITDTLAGTNVTYLLVAAATSNPDATLDSFKVNALNFSPGTNIPTSTPEPGSMFLLGTALITGGMLLRRRKN